MNKTEIIDAYKQYLMPTYAPEVAIEKGKGSKVFGVGGTQYYDFTAGIGVHNIGHSHLTHSGPVTTITNADAAMECKMLVPEMEKRGYGKGAEQMVWSVKTVDLYDIKTRRSARPGSEPKDFRPTHIAIDLAVRIDGKTQKVRTQ